MEQGGMCEELPEDRKHRGPGAGRSESGPERKGPWGPPELRGRGCGPGQGELRCVAPGREEQDRTLVWLTHRGLRPLHHHHCHFQILAVLLAGFL